MRAAFAVVASAALLFSSVSSFASVRSRHEHHVRASEHRASLHSRTSARFRHISYRFHHREERREVHHAAMPAMNSERATQIQAALIRQGYLTGTPSGVWDAQSIAAMQKMQADNGWQTKFTPDSRALIKLGLGGSDLASTASVAAPAAPIAAPAATAVSEMAPASTSDSADVIAAQ